MLERLDEIDWTSLESGLGPATEVPQLIRALLSTSEEVRGQAYFDLHSTIVHQGTVYESSVEAIPFLIELLKAPTVPDREQLVLLLAAITEGTGYYLVHGDSLNLIPE